MNSEGGSADIMVEAAQTVSTVEFPAVHASHLVNSLTTPVITFKSDLPELEPV